MRMSIFGSRALACAALLAIAGAARGGVEGMERGFAFSGAGDERVIADLPFSGDGDGATALRVQIEFRGDAPGAGTYAVTVHLRSGEGWWSCEPGAGAFAGGEGTLGLGDFRKEGDAGDIRRADLLRISLWPKGAASGVLAVQDAEYAGAARVAVVKATTTAPGEEWFAGAMAERCVRLLRKAGVRADCIGDDFRALEPYGVVFLPYSPKLGVGGEARLSRFVKGGGKLVVFYQSSTELGRAMGIRPGGWRGGEEWTGMTGEGFEIPHRTDNVLPPNALPGGGAEVVATWRDGTGLDSHIAAVAVGGGGAWFGHVPPLAYPAAVRLVGGWMKDWIGEGRTGGETAGRWPDGSESLKIAGAWVNGVQPGTRGGWREVGKSAAVRGLNTLYVRWGAAGFPLADERTRAETLRATEATGTELHAWVTCFSMDGLSETRKARMAAERRGMAEAAGWLDPRMEKNHEMVIEGLVALAKSGVQGVQLDYVRTPDGVAATPETTAAITEFVRKASTAVRKACPGVSISAAVFPTVSAAAARNQDWPRWVAEGLVDYVCPMIYSEDAAEFAAELQGCVAAAGGEHIVAGIGTGAEEAQTDGATTMAEVEAALRMGVRGVAFYAWDAGMLGAVPER